MVAMEQTARCQIAIELYCLTTHVSHFLLLTMKIVKPDLFLTQNSVEFPFLIFFLFDHIRDLLCPVYSVVGCPSQSSLYSAIKFNKAIRKYCPECV